MAETMTKQEIFDTVARHLLTQGVKSEIGRGCVYRGPNGLKCAAGALISDEHYTEALEGRGVSGGQVQQALERSGIPPSAFYLVEDLQDCHDGDSPDKWPGVLREIAEYHSLSDTVLNESADSH